jgi:hypothetical protein
LDILSQLGPETIFPFFLSIFTIVGALSIGNGLRSLFVEPRHIGRGANGVLTGLVFVAVAIFMGTKAVGSGMRIMGIRYAPFQIGLAIIVVASIFLLGDSLKPVFQRPDILIGAIFVIVGMTIMGFMIRGGEPVRSMAFAALFAGMGALVLGRALWKMIRGDQPDDAAD